MSALTHIYSLKCLACGLHFNVYSWSDDWPERHVAYCPECGRQGGCFELAHHETPDEIFTFVPGLSRHGPSQSPGD